MNKLTDYEIMEIKRKAIQSVPKNTTTININHSDGQIDFGQRVDYIEMTGDPFTAITMDIGARHELKLYADDDVTLSKMAAMFESVAKTIRTQMQERHEPAESTNEDYVPEPADFQN